MFAFYNVAKKAEIIVFMRSAYLNIGNERFTFVRSSCHYNLKRGNFKCLFCRGPNKIVQKCLSCMHVQHAYLSSLKQSNF